MPEQRIYKRGDFLISDAGGTCSGTFVDPPRNYTRVRDLPPDPEGDEVAERLAAERETLKRRLLDIQQRVSALRGKPS
jgi:hypothetical protein